VSSIISLPLILYKLHKIESVYLFFVPYAWPVLSGSACNLARGILIHYRWSRGVSECRSSPQALTLCAVRMPLQITADRGHVTRGRKTSFVKKFETSRSQAQWIERRRRKVWPSAVCTRVKC